MFTTKVGKFDVQVRNAHIPSLVWFDAGVHGKSFGERGMFCFWAAILKSGKRRKIWGRALACLPAGDRFDRMKREQNTAKTAADRKVYRTFWADRMGKGGNIAYIRPCTDAEIKKWADMHMSDAKFMKRVARPESR